MNRSSCPCASAYVGGPKHQVPARCLRKRLLVDRKGGRAAQLTQATMPPHEASFSLSPSLTNQTLIRKFGMTYCVRRRKQAEHTSLTLLLRWWTMPVPSWHQSWKEGYYALLMLLPCSIERRALARHAQYRESPVFSFVVVCLRQTCWGGHGRRLSRSGLRPLAGRLPDYKNKDDLVHS